MEQNAKIQNIRDMTKFILSSYCTTSALAAVVVAVCSSTV